MSLSKQDTELLNKIEAGLKLAMQRLYEKRAANNETVIISDANGNIQHVSAREILNKRNKI